MFFPFLFSLREPSPFFHEWRPILIRNWRHIALFGATSSSFSLNPYMPHWSVVFILFLHLPVPFVFKTSCSTIQNYMIFASTKKCQFYNYVSFKFLKMVWILYDYSAIVELSVVHFRQLISSWSVKDIVKSCMEGEDICS